MESSSSNGVESTQPVKEVEKEHHHSWFAHNAGYSDRLKAFVLFLSCTGTDEDEGCNEQLIEIVDTFPVEY